MNYHSSFVMHDIQTQRGEVMNKYAGLAEKAKLGQTDAFSELYEIIYKDLYRFALYILKNTHDAEDVVSDTVMNAYQEIRSLRSPELFKAWIFRILTNKCKQRLKQYTKKTMELPDDIPESERDLCEEIDVRRAFALLTDEERLILGLNIFGGYNSKEIGKTLFMSPNTVRSKQSRALKKMELSLTK